MNSGRRITYSKVRGTAAVVRLQWNGGVLLRARKCRWMQMRKVTVSRTGQRAQTRMISEIADRKSFLTGNDRIGANMGRPKGSKNKAKTPPAETPQAAAPEQPKQAPKAQRLPGMENTGIPELEVIAEALYKVRKDRIALSKREGELSDDLLKMMKHFSKVEYHHEQVHAWREVTEEKVKVTIGELNAAKEKQIKDAVKGHLETQAGDADVPKEVVGAGSDSPKSDAEDDLPEDLEGFEEELQEDAELPADV